MAGTRSSYFSVNVHGILLVQRFDDKLFISFRARMLKAHRRELGFVLEHA